MMILCENLKLTGAYSVIDYKIDPITYTEPTFDGIIIKLWDSFPI